VGLLGQGLREEHGVVDLYEGKVLRQADELGPGGARGAAEGFGLGEVVC
jgi:hypothetical protein